MLSDALYFFAWLFAHAAPAAAPVIGVLLAFSVTWRFLEQRFNIDL